MTVTVLRCLYRVNKENISCRHLSKFAMNEKMNVITSNNQSKILTERLILLSEEECKHLVIFARRIIQLFRICLHATEFITH